MFWKLVNFYFFFTLHWKTRPPSFMVGKGLLIIWPYLEQSKTCFSLKHKESILAVFLNYLLYPRFHMASIEISNWLDSFFFLRARYSMSQNLLSIKSNSCMSCPPISSYVIPNTYIGSSRCCIFGSLVPSSIFQTADTRSVWGEENFFQY